MAGNLLVAIKRSGTERPLFLVPSAGTTVFSLVNLARKLKSPRPLHAFEFLDLPLGAERPRTMEGLASLFIAEIRRVQPVGPYLLGGHCFGGTVAFEIATQFETMGENVTKLALLETIPPFSPALRPDDLSAPFRAEIVKAGTELCGNIRENLARLPANVAERLGPLSWELIDLVLHYQAAPILAPLLLIRTPTHPDEVFRNWRPLAPGGFVEHIVPGDTFSMLSERLVGAVCSSLDEALDKGAG
jgi:thioesterase domain-containing protein